MKEKSPSLFRRILRQPAMTAVRACEIAASYLYLSKPVQAVRAARYARIPASRLRVALLAHVYYPELLDEICKVHANLPSGAKLIITAPPEQARQVAEQMGDHSLVEILAVPNRGRDIAPFLHALQSGALDEYDAVLKLHTKKSPHLMLGTLRRRFFFSALAGSPSAASAILRQFEAPSTGLVGPGPFFRTAPAYWMGNQARVEQLAAALGAEAALGFFEGSMFWVRPAALAGLKALGLRPDDFDAEAGQLDGTLHHAVERLFPIAAAKLGYDTRSIGGRLLLPRYSSRNSRSGGK